MYNTFSDALARRGVAACIALLAMQRLHSDFGVGRRRGGAAA